MFPHMQNLDRKKTQTERLLVYGGAGAERGGGQQRVMGGRM
jgi:hypothetical protein